VSSDHIPRMPVGEPSVLDQDLDSPGHDHADHEPQPEPTLKVLVYSDDRTARRQVLSSLGRRPHPDLPAIEYTECATEPMVIAQVDAQRFDLLILDGEAVPAGGMGIARQLKDEVFNCPPILVLIGRPQDALLATWSRADSVVPHPLEPLAVARAASALLQRRVAVTRS
jgi:DNA-binding response OmpR family regulator